MRVDVVRPGELAESDLEKWRALQQADADLRSPFFAPEFCRVVGQERDDAFVARIEDGTGTAAFFPFHRDGAPIGHRISDFHGVIGRHPLAWTAAELISRCGLSRWDFRCVPVSQTIFDPWRTTTNATLAIDLAGPRPHKMQTVTADFTWHTTSSVALSSLLECKSSQYRRTGIRDVFADPWITAVLSRLHASGDPGCRGVLSQLYHDGQLMAAHFGIRSSTVLHYWFPCYNLAFARSSPGLMLLNEIIRHAPSEGILRIDLGLAGAPYKDRFANARGTIARGSVTANQ